MPFITFQDKYTNRVTDGARERQVLSFIRKYFEKRGPNFLANMPGSSTMVQKASAVVVGPLVEINGAKVRLDPTIDPKKVKLKSKGAPSLKGTTQKNKPRKKKKARKPILTRGTITKAKQSTVSMATLLGILNSRINDVVADNMGTPRLENVSGRFAASVRITDVSKTTKGFPSIGYTYMRNPY